MATVYLAEDLKHKRKVAVTVNLPGVVLSAVLLILAAPAASQERLAGAARSASAQAARTWLTENAIPLQTVEAGHGFVDLEPLKAVIGDARVVSLGEATHGTREFFQLKHRMLEFLVTEMGFTVFGIEATMPEAFDVNEYVLHGTGDPGKALAGLDFWTWDTEEVLEMIEWMRRYNASQAHERKVKFYGFDMQIPTRAVRVMLEYLRRVDPEAAGTADSTLSFLANPFTYGDFDRLPPPRKAYTAALVTDLLNLFDSSRAVWVAGTSVSDWEVARQHAQVLVQNLDVRSQPLGVGGNIRDRAMADNIGWILEHEGPAAKIVVWAHNFHVATTTWGDNDDSELMGLHLQRRFGEDLRTFGFAFNQGSFQALDAQTRGLRRFRVGPAPEGSYDAVLAATGHPLAVIDLRAIPETGPVADWFSVPHATRGIGAGYSESAAEFFLRETDFGRQYDALFFVEATTAARANPWVTVAPLATLSAPVNLDFEYGPVGDVPTGWMPLSRRVDFDYRVVTADGGAYGGERAAVVSRIPGRQYGETFGGLEQRINAGPYHGRTIRLTAAVRTEGGPGDDAYLWLSTSRGRRDTRRFDRVTDAISTSEWRVYELTADVAKYAITVEYGLAVVGGGRAWLDSVSLTIH
jgi:erythromycin esterase